MCSKQNSLCTGKVSASNFKEFKNYKMKKYIKKNLSVAGTW